MKNFRFAHIADAHIGAWPRDPGLQRALRASVLRAFDLVRESRSEFLLISGDLFHNPTPEPTEAAPVAAALRELHDAGIRVYAIFGSHDYVVHQISWLDVLSEGGLFARVAPSPRMEEGQAWDLPWVRDEPTGAVIAGVSGRTQGLDAHAFETMRSEGFLAEQGFHIFLYHAAILEYLPPELQGMVTGVPLARLPKGCGYYAGGHIHETYSGMGPDGQGVLVNPGATFGTSITDLDKIARGLTRAGVVIVDVKEGKAHPDWRITTPSESIRFVDIKANASSITEATTKAREAWATPRIPGETRILVPRLHGERDGSTDITALMTALRGLDPGVVHLDLNDLTAREVAPPSAIAVDPNDVEGSVLSSILSALPPLPDLSPEATLRVARELLHELRRPQSSGETAEVYRRRTIDVAIHHLDRLRTERGARR